MKPKSVTTSVSVREGLLKKAKVYCRKNDVAFSRFIQELLKEETQQMLSKIKSKARYEVH
jgi:hypothetical protein